MELQRGVGEVWWCVCSQFLNVLLMTNLPKPSPPRSPSIMLIRVSTLLFLLFLLFFLPYTLWKDSMRFDHPKEAIPLQGYLHPIQDKVTYCVRDWEYTTLSILFWGWLICLTVGFGMTLLSLLNKRE